MVKKYVIKEFSFWTGVPKELMYDTEFSSENIWFEGSLRECRDYLEDLIKRSQELFGSESLDYDVFVKLRYNPFSQKRKNPVFKINGKTELEIIDFCLTRIFTIERRS